jgi:hypothetical protein
MFMAVSGFLLSNRDSEFAFSLSRLSGFYKRLPLPMAHHRLGLNQLFTCLLFSFWSSQLNF